MGDDTKFAAIYFCVLNKMAAMTPGIHPQQVRIKTSRMAPQPRSITARGGKRIHTKALRIPMIQR